jgi:hypothetical protein
MVDAASEATVDHEASLTIRIHGPPSSCAGAVPSTALCFSSAENTRWVGLYRTARVGLWRTDRATSPSVAMAVAEKVSALETATFFEDRKARADFKAFDRIMRRRGGELPREGDEIPE